MWKLNHIYNHSKRREVLAGWLPARPRIPRPPAATFATPSHCAAIVDRPQAHACGHAILSDCWQQLRALCVKVVYDTSNDTAKRAAHCGS
jgi:hypothetical protein